MATTSLPSKSPGRRPASGSGKKTLPRKRGGSSNGEELAAPTRFGAAARASAPGRTGRGGAYIRLDHRVRARLLAGVWRVRYDCTPAHTHVTSSDLRVEAKPAPGRRGHSRSEE